VFHAREYHNTRRLCARDATSPAKTESHRVAWWRKGDSGDTFQPQPISTGPRKLAGLGCGSGLLLHQAAFAPWRTERFSLVTPHFYWPIKGETAREDHLFYAAAIG